MFFMTKGWFSQYFKVSGVDFFMTSELNNAPCVKNTYSSSKPGSCCNLGSVVCISRKLVFTHLLRENRVSTIHKGPWGELLEDAKLNLFPRCEKNRFRRRL